MKSNQHLSGASTLVQPNNDKIFPVAGVGASAGGLDAFKTLIKAIPDNSGIAWILVQHQHPSHESVLTELLQKVTAVPVIEITGGMPVRPGNIYVMPSNKMLTVKNGKLKLTPRPARDKIESNYPIDLFFASLALLYESNAIGIVLSGTASDGTKGSKAIKDHGGITMAQTIGSAAYAGMPESVIAAGVADFILPPEEIPKKLLEIKNIISKNEELQSLPEEDERSFKEILSLLHNLKGMDFTYYKQSTIRRRILRRMVLNKYKKIADYTAYLTENKNEVNALYQDMLIPVTSFFRDAKVFDNLCGTVFPELIKNKSAEGHIRIWVAGCSTGEEAYSIAICFKEYLGHKKEKVQIFATDLSEPAIAKARAGIYTKGEAELVSHHRLKKFFTVSQGNYMVNKELRDMCVFAVHNFLKDPPFVKIDLISCRNVLIYMDTYLQKKALSTFHYALNPKALLMLGKSENTIGITDLFSVSNKSEKIFSRKNVAPKIPPVTARYTEPIITPFKKSTMPESIRNDFQKVADDILLSKYTPAAVVVNEALDIVQFRGNTSLYLEQSPGKPTHNLLKMAKMGLAFELRSIVHKAIKEKRPVKKENFAVQLQNAPQYITLEAVPVAGMIEPHWLIIFNDVVKVKQSANVFKTSRNAKKDEDTLRLQQLEQELAQIREDMRSITEEQEAGNEELQSTNEELLSSNEELQSLNEELETSKEELQSTVEELTVVNQEMVNLNEQLATEKEYAESIIATIPQPLLILDKHLRVISANELFYQKFLVNESQTEGKLIYDIGNRQWDVPELKQLLGAILLEKKSLIGFEVEQDLPKLGHCIMRLNAREIKKEKGEKMILLVIEDVTAYVKALRRIEETEHRYANMIYSSPFMIAILEGKDMIIKDANETILSVWGVGKEVIGSSLYKIRPEVIESGRHKMLNKVFETGEPHYGYELPVETRRNGKDQIQYFTFIYQAQKDINGNIEGVAILANEVTPQAVFNKRIKESEEKTRAVIENAPFPIAVYIGKELKIELANQSILDIWGKGNNVVGKSFRDILPELADQKVFEQLEGVFDTGVPFHAKNQRIDLIINGNLHPYYFNYSFTPLYNSSGEIYGVMNTAADVTDLTVAKQKAEEAEEQFSTLADNMENLAWIADGNGTIYWYNKRWYEYTGTTLDEMYGWGWTSVHHPAHIERVLEFVKKAWSVNEPFELTFPLRRADGIYKWFLTRVYPILNDEGKITQWIGTNTDIDEQKKAEDQFRLLADQAPMWVWLTDKEVNVLYANSELLKFIGIEHSSAFTGHTWEQKVHPEDIQKVYSTFGKAVAEQRSFDLEYRVQNSATTEYEWIYIKGVPHFEANEFTGFIGTGVNIHHNKLILKQLEYRTALLEAHNESSVDGILLVDTKGKILSHNHRFIDIWNIPQHIADAKDDDAAMKFVLPQLLDTEKFIEKVKWHYNNPEKTSLDELELLNGKIIERHGYPVKAPDGSYYAWSWIFRDITEQRTSERTIKESEERYHQLIVSSPSGIGVLKGKSFIITTANDTIISYWGKGREIMGKPYFEALPELIEQGYEEVFSNVYKTGEPFNAIETPVRFWQNGKMNLRYYNFLLYAQRNIYNEIEGIGIIATEVTSHALLNKQIQESEKRFRLLADSMPQQVWTADVEGNLNYFNQTVFDYSGLSLEQINKDGWLQIVHPEDRENNIREWKASIMKATDFLFEHRFRRYDGEYRWQLSRALPQKDAEGNITMWVGSSTDIQKIKEEEKRKSDFIKMVSHELKTPVTSIKGYVQFLLYLLKDESKIPAELSPLRSSLLRIDMQIIRLTRLITEMLDLSRIESGKLDLQEQQFSINELVVETIQDISHTSTTHKLNLQNDHKSEIVGDRDRLGQVLINLINNAIKYSPESNMVNIRIFKTDQDQAAVSIQDHGIGISKEDQEKIFERFYRVEGKREEVFSGFGIGLFIANEIIQRHHGSITVESTVGKGSIFTFMIPLSTKVLQNG